MNRWRYSSLRIILGLVLLLVALVWFSKLDPQILAGELVILILANPAPYFRFWVLLVLPMVSAIAGIYLVLSTLRFLRKPIFALWIVVYSMYLLLLLQSGRQLVFQAFEFTRWPDAVYLLLLCLYCGLLLSFLVDVTAHLDIVAAFAGLLFSVLFMIAIASYGPGGVEIGDTLQRLNFALGLPAGPLMMYCGFFALIMNTTRLFVVEWKFSKGTYDKAWQ